MNELREKKSRRINKQQAVRHLLHAAIRMIRAEEDPFAIHVLVQSAEKLLIDLSKRKGVKLPTEMGLDMTPEHRARLFSHYRGIYNFFKHADKDHDKVLMVPDMMVMNILVLSTCIVNYGALYNGYTEHMKTHLFFAMAAYPGSMFKGNMDKIAQMKSIEAITPRDFFAGFSHPDVSVRFMGIEDEKKEDLQDTGEFYATYLPELEDLRFRPK